MRAAAVQERDEDGHGHGGAADEDAGDGGFRRTFGGEDGEVETEHADGGEHPEARPLADGERAQPRGGAAPGERDQQQAGERVAQELAARVGVVAEQAVGGEGSSDEDAGERGEQRAARGGGVHGSDARKGGGPV
ncbi:hypothetical protein ADL34_03870 [Streptomyces sp. NRRL WC-3605]|nr:hypothetical protein ADL34_03870 [Streptomyces sp. NRRL WC-3605]